MEKYRRSIYIVVGFMNDPAQGTYTYVIIYRKLTFILIVYCIYRDAYYAHPFFTSSQLVIFGVMLSPSRPPSYPRLVLSFVFINDRQLLVSF